MADVKEDIDFGSLTWDDSLEWWEGSARLESEGLFALYVLSRSQFIQDREISSSARTVFKRVRKQEAACRRYAADQLLEIHNAEWSEGNPIAHEEFVVRLTPDAIEIHENGYCEVHFGDGGLFFNHGVGVRIRSDGSFQEAVVEG